LLVRQGTKTDRLSDQACRHTRESRN
jgi:hypothetical protein